MYTVNEEAAVGSSAPKLAAILDELEVLKVQLAESAARFGEGPEVFGGLYARDAR